MFISDPIDIAVIGAGPQALTLVTHLLQKRKDWHARIRVLDPSGVWMSQWQRQFRAQEIPHLRSPAVHHPDPNPYELRRFAESHPQGLIPPYDRPTTAVFEGFCQDVVQRRVLGSRFVTYVLLAMGIGGLSAVLGMIGSAAFNLPSGPSIVTTQLMLFLLGMGVSGLKGIPRR